MHALQDKVALITGGSSGIGRATALRLAKFRAKVVVAARNREALDQLVSEITTAGGEAFAVPTDVTDLDQCRGAVESAVNHFGRLDILLSSAGVSMRTYFEGSNLASVEKVFRVNFFGTLHTTYFAIPHVKKTRGSLVAISSLTGKRGIPSYAVYGASKFAVQGLYDSLRVELKHNGVHVGTVSPGFVDTPLRDKVLGPDGQTWKEPPAPPFRVWPVEKCVDRVIDLLVKRKPQALLPAFAGPFILLDQAMGGGLGDRILAARFPPEKRE